MHEGPQLSLFRAVPVRLRFGKPTGLRLPFPLPPRSYISDRGATRRIIGLAGREGSRRMLPLARLLLVLTGRGLDAAAGSCSELWSVY